MIATFQETARIANAIVQIANRLLFGTNQRFTGDRSHPLLYSQPVPNLVRMNLTDGKGKMGWFHTSVQTDPRPLVSFRSPCVYCVGRSDTVREGKMLQKRPGILLAGFLLMVSACADQSTSRDWRNDLAQVAASAEVDFRHGCEDGETLFSGMRDYQKRPLCSMCEKGQTFVADKDKPGGGLYSCSACGSGDVVFKVSDVDREEDCHQLANAKRREEKDGLTGTDELMLAQTLAEIRYNCRAGDQASCKSEQEWREEIRFAQTRAQTAALQSQAQAAWAQAAAQRKANEQRWEASRGLPVQP